MLSMQPNSSPGPDGFGPSFYKSCWAIAHPAILCLLNAFHQCSVELDRINRSYIVLLPKKDHARSPSDFRPICLQNCPVKGISKVLTNRLQLIIPSLIGDDQTGFVWAQYS